MLLKKTIDKATAFLVLIILSPLIGVIALFIWMTMGRPLFFRQKRSGMNGRPFQITKFRTMMDMRDSGGRTLSDEVRLTAVGRFLRGTSLDELPEFWNVFCGEMSLVGPRPLMAQYFERYSPEQARRLEVLPGITGWAQIHGRNHLSWEQKFALDVWYVDEWSLGLDFHILIRTLWYVVRGEGIRPSDRSSVPEFMGTSSLAESERQLQYK
ncbi:MAG TPA: sugar transferase [Terriglobales bacterium]|nr:sugar transferase [Terriglobales bacterium]